MQIKSGQIVAITKGEYSDYCLGDHMRALKDFDSDGEIERFKRDGNYLAVPEWDKSGEPDAYGSDERFLAWLIREGFLEPLPDEVVVELWIGSYGQLGGL